MSSCNSSDSRRPLRVRVNAELVLDAGCCLDVDAANGPLHVVEPLRTTLFQQVLAYLEEKPDPPRPPSGSMIGREGLAAAAVAALSRIEHGGCDSDRILALGQRRERALSL